MDNRRDLMTMMGGALLAAGATPASGKTTTWIKTPDDAHRVETPFGSVYRYYRGETDQSRLLETLQVRLNPGFIPHEPHKHPEEEILLVLEGEGEFIVDGQTTACSAGSMCYAASGSLHSFRNTGSATMVVHIFKWGPK